MKRSIALLLALVMLLALAACDTSEKPASQSEDHIPVTNTSLLSAAEKLKTADSYRLQMIAMQNAEALTVQQILEYQVSKAENGTITISNEDYSIFTQNGQTTENEEDKAYYIDKTGYVYDTHRSPQGTDKMISDTPFTLVSVLEYQENFAIGYDENSVLGLFDAMDTTKTFNQDGSITVQSKDLTANQWFTLFCALSNEPMDETQGGDAFTNCSAYGKIDDQGYLTEFCLETSMPATDDEIGNASWRFVIDQINSVTITEPDYVNNFEIENGTSITYLKDGTDAHYCYYSLYDYYDSDGNWVTTSGMVFEGFGSYYWQDYTVDTYEVLSEVEGYPVVAVRDISLSRSNSISVTRLVIPVGVRGNVFGIYGETVNCDTVLFFMDSKENIEKNFYLTGETPDADDDSPVYVKAAYYSGEWEYESGIPTPTK